MKVALTQLVHGQWPHVMDIMVLSVRPLGAQAISAFTTADWVTYQLCQVMTF